VQNKFANVVVDNRLRVDPQGYTRASDIAPFLSELKAETSYANPDRAKLKAMGRYTGHLPSKLSTWRIDQDDGVFTLGRGSLAKLRAAAKRHGIPLRLQDRRVRGPDVEWPPFTADPDDPAAELFELQRDALRVCLEKQQGIVRAATGGGKTHIALALAAASRGRVVAIMRSAKLLEQWHKKAVRHLGLRPDEIGVIAGGKKHRVGERLTLALQQSLWAKRFPLVDFVRHFDVVLVDEIQEVPARTVFEIVDAFPAMLRVGFSADETRNDGKERLTYDVFGPVIAEIDRSAVIESGFNVPVTVRVVPSDFEAEWYRRARGAEKDHKRLVDEVIADRARDALIRDVVRDVAGGERSSGQWGDGSAAPVLVFSHRREHVDDVERMLVDAGLRCGVMVGGQSDRFDEASAFVERGLVEAVAGTYQAIGVGIDMPRLRSGICATPIGNNRQFFGQVRGRICRSAPGKDRAFLYYVWDRHVFPDQVKKLAAWNDGDVEVLRAGQWVRFEPKEERRWQR